MAQRSEENRLEDEACGWMREFLHENMDLIAWEVLMQEIAKTAKPLPQNTCGQCSAYKTPFCVFANYQGVIAKKDQCCGSFYPDRHIPRDRLKKPRVVQRKVE